MFLRDFLVALCKQQMDALSTKSLLKGNLDQFWFHRRLWTGFQRPCTSLRFSLRFATQRFGKRYAPRRAYTRVPASTAAGHGRQREVRGALEGAPP